MFCSVPIPLSNAHYHVQHDAPCLGTGSYATVMPAHVIADPTRSIVAKVTNLNKAKHRGVWRNEHRVFAVLAAAAPHPHIIQCMDKYIISNHGVLVLERFKGVTLEEHLTKVGPLSGPDMLNALDQIACALHHLHGRNIAMRDLKPENIAYDAATRTCKLFDFGLSAILPCPGARVTKSKGSPVYMSPEMLRTVEHDPMRADHWALGQVIYQMLTGHSMFGFCADMPALQHHVSRCAYMNNVFDYIKDSSLSLEQENLILGLCAYQPSKRWDLARVAKWLDAEDDAMC